MPTMPDLADVATEDALRITLEETKTALALGLDVDAEALADALGSALEIAGSRATELDDLRADWDCHLADAIDCCRARLEAERAQLRTALLDRIRIVAKAAARDCPPPPKRVTRDWRALSNLRGMTRSLLAAAESTSADLAAGPFEGGAGI